VRYYSVTMFEDGRVIEVRVKAQGAGAATRKAEELCPDAAHLTTRLHLSSGVSKRELAIADAFTPPDVFSRKV